MNLLRWFSCSCQDLSCAPIECTNIFGSMAYSWKVFALCIKLLIKIASTYWQIFFIFLTACWENKLIPQHDNYLVYLSSNRLISQLMFPGLCLLCNWISCLCYTVSVNHIWLLSGISSAFGYGIDYAHHVLSW